MGVLRADDLETVDWVGMACCAEWTLENGKLFGACVPDEDLATVCPADDDVRVEGGECYGEDVRLSVEDELGSIEEVEIPYEHKAIWRVGVSASTTA